MAELTREVVQMAFDRIGQMARERSIVCEIAVYGGSAIMLASDARLSTGDVDAVMRFGRDEILEMADVVGREMGLPNRWLNDAVRRLAPPQGGREPYLSLFADYPRDNEGAVGLKVNLPTPAYLIAMKLFANRLAEDTDKLESDMGDIHNLMKVTGIDTYDGLLDLLIECYPDVPKMGRANVSLRIDLKIKAALDGYKPDELSPTWDAPKGPATR